MAIKRRRGRPSRTVTVREDDIAVLKRRRGKTKRQSSRTAWTFDFEDLDDWAPYISADWLLAEVADAVLEEHVAAIEDGVRPGTGELQPPLDPFGTQGRRAKKGKRPHERGMRGRTDGRGFSDLITRTKIKARGSAKLGKGKVGTGASCEIKPGSFGHKKFVENEAKFSDVGYFDVEGPIEKAIEKRLSEVLDEALQGPPKPGKMPEFGQVQGKDLA